MEHHTGSQRNIPVLPEVQRETEPGEEGEVQVSLRGVGKRKVAKLGGAAGANLLGRSVAAVAGLREEAEGRSQGSPAAREAGTPTSPSPRRPSRPPAPQIPSRALLTPII